MRLTAGILTIATAVTLTLPALDLTTASPAWPGNKVSSESAQEAKTNVADDQDAVLLEFDSYLVSINGQEPPDFLVSEEGYRVTPEFSTDGKTWFCLNDCETVKVRAEVHEVTAKTQIKLFLSVVPK